MEASKDQGHRSPLTPSRLFTLFFTLAFPAAIAALLALRRTRPFAVWLLEENHPVEMVTFISLAAGALMGFDLIRRRKAVRLGATAVSFYLLMSLGLLLTAMEEVSWGQQLFGFHTPQALLAVNRQGETTLHNLQGVQGHTEYFRLAFGLGGLIGVALGRLGYLRSVAPATSLTPWFFAISALAGIDLYNDFFSLGKTPDFIVERLAEVVEMLVGISGFLYLRQQRVALTAATKPA